MIIKYKVCWDYSIELVEVMQLEVEYTVLFFNPDTGKWEEKSVPPYYSTWEEAIDFMLDNIERKFVHAEKKYQSARVAYRKVRSLKKPVDPT